MEPRPDVSLRAALALARVPGIGPVNFRRLVETFGGPADVWTKGVAELSAVEGIGDERARAISSFRAWDEVDAELERAAARGLSCLAYGDDDYPAPLAEIYDPPPVLYYKGDVTRWPGVMVAVVGTRRPTDYGVHATAFLCEPLAEGGVGIVSGMAKGIDACAHRAALKAGGFTVAVLGCGADVAYPPENDALYREICERGVVVSEFPPGAPPEPANFPRRNRVISGLAAGVLVVEAGEKSGALITAALAAEQGREVFAVPGSIFAPTSAGCRRLIQSGAKAAGTALEILEEIAPAFAPARPERAVPTQLALAALGGDEQTMLERVAGEARAADDLAAALGWEPWRAAAALLNLEIAGLIEKIPGNQYRRLY